MQPVVVVCSFPGGGMDVRVKLMIVFCNFVLVLSCRTRASNWLFNPSYVLFVKPPPPPSGGAESLEKPKVPSKIFGLH